ncbi:MAG: hypothetical protein ACK4HQ_01700 [Brevinematales bacterium]
MKWEFLWWIVLGFLVAGCGFVMEEDQSEKIDYEQIGFSFQSFRLGGASSYRISTTNDESYPVVYYAPWGRSYLFFYRREENFFSYDLCAAEMFLDGSFGEVRVVESNVYFPQSLAVVDGISNGVRVPLLQREGSWYQISSNLSLSSLGVDAPVSASSLSVWDGQKWERWAVFIEASSYVMLRYVFNFHNGWQVSQQVVIPQSDVLAFLAGSSLAGVGVVFSKETNFAFLRTVSTAQDKKVFQCFLVGFTAAGITIQTNAVYTWLTNVDTPFVDVLSGYQVYFSMSSNMGEEKDLYRFRYLTWEKMVPVTMRTKLP